MVVVAPRWPQPEAWVFCRPRCWQEWAQKRALGFLDGRLGGRRRRKRAFPSLGKQGADQGLGEVVRPAFVARSMDRVTEEGGAVDGSSRLNC